MKIALIPPIPNLRVVELCEVHLLLSHLVPDKTYQNFYRRQIRAYSNQYFILDNSAHEFKSGEVVKKLLQQGLFLQVNEIVIPDVLFQSGQTVQNLENSLKQITEDPRIRGMYQLFYPKLMIVPQGSDLRMFRDCLKRMVAIWTTYREHNSSIFLTPPTIGVSKDYEMWEGGLLRLLHDDILPIANKLGSDVHMLGWGRDLWAILQINQKYGTRIRSIDSAKPFVYAKSGIELKPPEAIPPYPKRTEDYFTKELSYSELEIAKRNVKAFYGLIGQPSPIDTLLVHEPKVS